MTLTKLRACWAMFVALAIALFTLIVAVGLAPAVAAPVAIVVAAVIVEQIAPGFMRHAIQKITSMFAMLKTASAANTLAFTATPDDAFITRTAPVHRHRTSYLDALGRSGFARRHRTSVVNTTAAGMTKGTPVLVC